jgi:hypothetical protein
MSSTDLHHRMLEVFQRLMGAHPQPGALAFAAILTAASDLLRIRGQLERGEADLAAVRLTVARCQGDLETVPELLALEPGVPLAVGDFLRGQAREWSAIATALRSVLGSSVP